MTTVEKIKDSPSWMKHVATAVTSIAIAWIGAWQTASAMAPNVNTGYPYDKSLIQYTLRQHGTQLSQIQARLNKIDIEVATSNTLLHTLVNGGRLGK